MKRFTLLLMMVCISFTVVNCIPSDEPLGPEIPNVGDIVLSQNEITVEASGGAFSVDFFTTFSIGSCWTDAISNVAWIEPTEILFNSNAEYNTLCFTVAENNTGISREGMITIMCDDYNLSATLLVVQESFSLTLILDEGTRTHLGEKVDGIYPLYWSHGDNVMCNGVISNSTTIDAMDAGIAKFSFDTALSAPYNIVYPAPQSGVTAKTDGCYPVEFKSIQKYTEHSFDSNAAPMYAYTFDTISSLTQLSGAMCLSIVGDVKLSNIVVTAETGYISGVFDLNCQTGEIIPQEDLVSNQIEITFDGGLQLTEQVTAIYWTMPPGSYGIVSLSISTVDGQIMLVEFNSDSKPISSGVIREFTTLRFSANQNI